MILLREAQPQDVKTLEQFAQIPGFINLPDDREMLQLMIRRSQESFSGKLKDKLEGKYVFIAEDIESRRVVGTSMIAAQHGTAESPHFYFEVGNEKKFSKTINTGFIHGTLKLKYDINGPSEIGGLVVDPELRNSPERIGRQVSFTRFLYLGINPQRFQQKIIAELLPPLNRRGQSPLWEAIGRRFTNMDYWEADRLCQRNKEFIFSLFPTGKIYTTFFSAEARNAIGKVGKQTEPVYHMLQKIGFAYVNQVDPFDGGPHLWADVERILPITKMRRLTLSQRPPAGDSLRESGLLCRAAQAVGEFRALSAEVQIEADELRFGDPNQADRMRAVLGLQEGEDVVFMPYY